ncbi:hypothetical protein ACN5VD_001872 [Campylobacter coli]
MDTDEKIGSYIKCALDIWNFNLAGSIYVSNYNKNNEIKMDYSLFLYETGQLNTLYTLIKDFEKAPYWWKEGIIGEDFLKLKKMILYLIQKDCKSIESDANSLIPHEILSCYLLNRYLEIGKLDVNFAVNNFNNFIVASKSSLTKSYFVAKCIDYFYATRQNTFFEKTRFHLTSLMANQFFRTRTYDSYMNIIHDVFKEKLELTISKKRVAILISGMFRGDYEYLLKNIEKNIAKPLNADIFIFSWDKVALWPGLCGGGGNWVNRLFRGLLSIAPKDILGQIGFKDTLPLVYQKLSKEYLDKLQAIKLIPYVGISVDSEENFLKELEKFPKAMKFINNNINATERDQKYWINTFKQLYGWGKCVELIKQYEQENHFEYTHIMRLRPDRSYGLFDVAHLNILKDDEIASGVLDYGLSDCEFYGKRSAMIRYLSFWENFEIYLEMISKISGGIHPNYYMWLVVNNLKPIPCKFKLLSVPPPLFIPNFKNELKEDLIKLKGNKGFNNEKMEQYSIFFNNVQSFYQQLPQSTLQELEMQEKNQEFQYLTSKNNIEPTKSLYTTQSVFDSFTIKKQQLEIANLEQDLINKQLQARKLEKEIEYNFNILGELNLKIQGLEEKDTIMCYKTKQISVLQNDTQETTLKLNQTRYCTAKSRIQNHLSYKLGQAMIANSKSILGYIRMPFVLSYIYNKHKQEQKIYQEKIKKDPSLKLPPLESYSDYKEALKEKECLTYKLGEALIKANNNWYGGGYVKIWFEVRRLKINREKI